MGVSFRCATVVVFASALIAAGAVSRLDYPDADVVVLDDATRIEYSPDGTYVSENDERILALTEKGVRALRSASVSISRRYGDAEIVCVEVIGTNGASRAVDFRKTLKEATDNSSTASNIYDPLDRRITCAVPGMEVGEVRRIVTRERMLKPRMRNAFSTGALFESTMPIRRASLEIIAPANLPIASVKLRNPQEGTVTRSEDETLPGGRVAMRWVAENVPQAFPEPDMPPFGSVAQKLLVSTTRRWEDVSKWYWDLCRPRLEAVNAAMSNKVSNLLSGQETRIGKIRALFKFVSQEVRYMGLTLEDESPGYAPHDVSVTFDNRYGVCRDKAALLVSMFRIAGIEAYPVLISVGPKMDEDVPLPYFNHAIVAVAREPGMAAAPGDFMLMDPTNESTHDLLPAYLMDCSYLVAHPEGLPLAVSPVKPSTENAFRADTKGTLASDGSALVEATVSFGGVNDLYRGKFLKMVPEDRRRFFERIVRASYPGAELLSFDMTPSDLRDTDTPLGVSLAVRLHDLVVRGKTRDELVPPFLFDGFAIADRILVGGTELEHRRYPLEFFSTALAEEKVSIRLGDSVGKVFSLPPDVKLGRNGYLYERCMSVDNGTFTAARKCAVDVTEISPEGYLELKQDLEAIELGERRSPQFSSRDEGGANVRTLYDRRDVHVATPYCWSVTNTWEREILTYAGKKASAELRYEYNPCVGSIDVVCATVSNRNGKVHSVTARERNVLDAGWVASAPRYPAAKRLVVNLPAVEIGSVIRVTTVQTVTNAPVAFCGQYSFDSVEPISVKELNVECGDLAMKVAWGGDVGRVIETNRICHAVTNPPALPREKSQPPSLTWRNCVIMSLADLDESRDALWAALAGARSAGADVAASKARELVRGAETAEEKVRAIRNWLWRNVRLAGPDMYSIPFDMAFFPPDRSISDGYASAADWMNAYYAMLEAVGFDVEYILSDGDAAGYPEISQVRRTVPQPDDFDDLLMRAGIREGGFLGLFGGELKSYVLDYENDCAPLGVRDVEGRNGRTENFMSIDVNDTGAARIVVSNSTWGVAVAGLRKLYSEMLPERRSRHYAELIGNIAESAEAISGLETDVKGYPFVIRYSAYAPNYAARNGDTISLVVPGLGGAFLPEAESERKSPFGVGGRLRPVVTVREVVMPEGYTAVERIPEGWELHLPGEDAPRCRSEVTSFVKGNRLHVLVKEELLPASSGVFGLDWLGYFRDWNRRTASRLVRTIVVRKGE